MDPRARLDVIKKSYPGRPARSAIPTELSRPSSGSGKVVQNIVNEQNYLSLNSDILEDCYLLEYDAV
jgi:hypothetical protein